MAKKKKRARKTSVFASVEGKRELHFLAALECIYDLKANNINLNKQHTSGGTPDKIISTAIKTIYGMRVFAWLDEDFEPEQTISKEVRETLAKCWNIKQPSDEFYNCPFPELQEKFNPNNRKPIIVTSKPVCVESVILKALGEDAPYDEYNPAIRAVQISKLKDKLDGLIGNKDQIEFFKERLCKDKLEDIRKDVPELDILISLITEKIP